MEFGEKLKFLRTILDLTQEDVAQKIGCSSKTIHRYESGRQQPDLHNLTQLSMLFDVSINFFNLSRKTDVEIIDEINSLSLYYKASYSSRIDYVIHEGYNYYPISREISKGKVQYSYPTLSLGFGDPKHKTERRIIRPLDPSIFVPLYIEQNGKLPFIVNSDIDNIAFELFGTGNTAFIREDIAKYFHKSFFREQIVKTKA